MGASLFSPCLVTHLVGHPGWVWLVPFPGPLLPLITCQTHQFSPVPCNAAHPAAAEEWHYCARELSTWENAKDGLWKTVPSRAIQIYIYGGRSQAGSTRVSNPRVKIEIGKKKKKEKNIWSVTSESRAMTRCGSHGLWYVTLCVILSSESLSFDLNKKHQSRQNTVIVVTWYSLQLV